MSVSNRKKSLKPCAGRLQSFGWPKITYQIVFIKYLFLYIFCKSTFDPVMSVIVEKVGSFKNVNIWVYQKNAICFVKK